MIDSNLPNPPNAPGQYEGLTSPRPGPPPLDIDAIRKRADAALTKRTITIGCSYDIEDLLDRNAKLEAARETGKVFQVSQERIKQSNACNEGSYISRMRRDRKKFYEALADCEES